MSGEVTPRPRGGGMLYFDHNATTPVRPEVLEVVARTQRDVFGNPSSQHASGRRARALLEESRERLAQVLGVAARELVFTSGGTEANRVALECALGPTDGEVPRLAVSVLEHASLLEPCRALEAAGRARIDWLRSESSGAVLPATVACELQPGTRAVILQHANNETGVLQPISEVAAVLNEARAAAATSTALLCDATQTFGKVPLSPPDLGADLLTFSSHKIGGPKGAGAVWARPGLLAATRRAGGPQERGWRPGTENLPAVVGFAEAAECARDEAAVRDDGAGFAPELVSALRERLGTVGLHVHGAGARLRNTVNLSFEGIEAELLLIRLDEEGVAVSTGSACASGAREPSHVLQAMGLAPERLRGAVRFSAGWSTTPAEAAQLVEVVVRVVEEFRRRAALREGDPGQR